MMAVNIVRGRWMTLVSGELLNSKNPPYDQEFLSYRHVIEQTTA